MFIESRREPAEVEKASIVKKGKLPHVSTKLIIANIAGTEYLRDVLPKGGEHV